MSLNTSAFNFGESTNHVSNRAGITIDNLRETAKLEVFNVSTVTYVTNTTKNPQEEQSWIEVKGNSNYIVDMEMLELILDDERNHALIRVPAPVFDFEHIDITEAKRLFFTKNGLQTGLIPIVNGTISDGEKIAQDQLKTARKQIQDEIESNEDYIKCAKVKAEKIIINLVYSLEKDNNDLIVEIEFY